MRSSFSFHSRPSSRSPTKSATLSSLSLGRSLEKNTTRLEDLARSIRAKASLLYDPGYIGKDAETSPKSHSSRKSVWFRYRHSTVPDDIEHSSPIAIPKDQPPVLPNMDFSNSALYDPNVAPFPPIVQTARPPASVTLGQTIGSISSQGVDDELNSSPAKSSMSKADSTGLPTPMPGTNLPLDDPFNDVDVARSPRHPSQNDISPPILSEASLVIHPSNATSRLQLFNEKQDLDAQKAANEDAGYVSDEESNADIQDHGQPADTFDSATGLSEGASSSPSKLDIMRRDGGHGGLADQNESSLKRTHHLPHRLNDLSLGPHLQRLRISQADHRIPSERYDADIDSSDIDSASDSEGKWRIGHTKTSCTQSDDDLSNASTDVDISISGLELKIFPGIEAPSQEHNASTKDRIAESVGPSGSPNVSRSVPAVW